MAASGVVVESEGIAGRCRQGVAAGSVKAELSRYRIDVLATGVLVDVLEACDEEGHGVRADAARRGVDALLDADDRPNAVRRRRGDWSRLLGR